MVFDDEDFYKLQQSWYDKLKHKGFKDIEKTDRNKAYLIQYHSHYFFQRHTPEDIESTEDYYRMCHDFYWRYQFKNKQEKSIWGMHADGKTYREIKDQTKRTFHFVQNLIARLRKIMHAGVWQSSEGADSDR